MAAPNPGASYARSWVDRCTVLDFTIMDDNTHRRRNGGAATLAGPVWLAAVHQSLATIGALDKNWDGEGAHRIDKSTINRALHALETALSNDFPAPSVVPAAVPETNTNANTSNANASNSNKAATKNANVKAQSK